MCDVLSPDDFCHFAGDVFCLFASKTRVLTTRNQLERRTWKNFFARLINFPPMQFRFELPTRVEWAAAALTAILLILSFPNFEFSFLAWVALVPLMYVIVRRPHARRAFILGWVAGTVFFYASCYWLTYSMIHYGELP